MSVLDARTRQPIEGFKHGSNVVLRPGDIFQVETGKDVENVIWEAKIAVVVPFQNEQNLRIDPDLLVKAAQPDWSKGQIHKIKQEFNDYFRKPENIS